MVKKEFIQIKIEDLIPYGNNPRHNEEAVPDVAESIRQCGDLDPIEVDENNVILSGHTRLLALRQQGFTETDVIRYTGLTEEQKKKYRLLANKTGEKATWDLEKLAEELDDLDFDGFDFGFDLDLENIEEEPEVYDDDYDPKPPEDPKSKRGDIYKLGRHRLMCGDSTSVTDVEALCGGRKIDLLLTDPPYNVNYEGGTGMKIQNDNMEDEQFRQFLRDAFLTADTVMKPGAAFYIWHADSEGYNFRGACHDIGWKVRQCLIWAKNTLVMGRQDYQWKHEPCQPAGTMVWTPSGKKPIEELNDGDRVISFDTVGGAVRGYKDGYEIKTASRHYDGILYGIKADGKQTWATDNHEFSVRFNHDTAEVWSTYLMVNEKGWWRVGVTRTYDARGFGLKHRFDQEHATAAWIISTFGNQADAQMGEQLLACKYGIPYTYWNVSRGQSDEYNVRTEKQIEWLYSNLDLEEMRKRAELLLANYGRSIKFPLVSEKVKADRFSRRVTAKINACNIIPGLMMVPIPKEHYEGTRTFEWATIEAVDHKEHHGKVYSLAVAKHHHYIADGIVTHNCLYGWKEGASHNWYSDRKQTTLLEFDRPTKSELHPTMKPVPLFDYQIKNSSRKGDAVLDLFGGSGTTMVACEQDGRDAFLMELDPRYVDVIIDRFEKLTGQKAELLNKEDARNNV